METLTFEQIIKNNEDQVKKLFGKPDEVVIARKKMDEDLNFSQIIWQFINDLKYYPVWHKNQKSDDGKPWWRSKTIKFDQLKIEKLSKSSLRFLIDKNLEKIKDDSDILEFVFKVRDFDKPFYFYTTKNSIHWEDGFGVSGFPFCSQIPVFIYYDNCSLVYKAYLKQGHDLSETNYEKFVYSDLKAFTPANGWITSLLFITDSVRKEEEEYGKSLIEGLFQNKKTKSDSF
ncbi:hypothetical protein HQ487_02365 [Candidatus Uhrbacteria bacterium]|nr:hypothetical protein [Candidatus Uhrbacteria bacterium]